MLLHGRGPICQPRHRTEKCQLGSKPRDISNSQPIKMKRVKKMTAMGVEPGQKGLRDRNSPMCTLSQNGYGAILSSRKQDPALTPVFLFTDQSLLPNAPPPHFLTGNKTSSDCAIFLGECSCAVGARFASPGTELKNAGSVASPETSQTPSP